MFHSREDFLIFSLLFTWVSIFCGVVAAYFWFVRGPKKNQTSPRDSGRCSELRDSDGAASDAEPATQVVSATQVRAAVATSVANVAEVKEDSVLSSERTFTQSSDPNIEELDDLPIDVSARDTALQAQFAREQEQRRLLIEKRRTTGHRGANVEKHKKFQEESNSLFENLQTVSKDESATAEQYEAVLRSIQEMLERVDKSFPGDRAGQVTAMSLICNVILNLDGLNLLSKAKSRSPDAEDLAQWTIEKVVPCIWSS